MKQKQTKPKKNELTISNLLGVEIDYFMGDFLFLILSFLHKNLSFYFDTTYTRRTYTHKTSRFLAIRYLFMNTDLIFFEAKKMKIIFLLKKLTS